MNRLKCFLESIISFVNFLILKLCFLGIKIDKCRFILVKVRTKSANIILRNTHFKKCHLNAEFSNNLNIDSAYLEKTSISIQGKNNTVTIDKGVILRNATIIVRGNSCKVNIGQDTTFGGVRIVAVGDKSMINIGRECLFSDHIELWASDSHPIFNKSGEFINPGGTLNIHDKVWVGSRVCILKNITVQSGSIVGMGSVVTKNVPSNVIVAGNPAKIIKENIEWKLNYPKGLV